MTCDLHTHSLFSDGTFSPAELIAEAKRLGLGAIALTDHNTVSGLPDFMEQAELNGVVGVGGVELSTAYRDIEFHLLGLFIDPVHYEKVERLAKEFHVLKEISNIEMIERLCDAGYIISYADVRKKNPNGNVNRAHVAAELLKKGYVESIEAAFLTLLHEDAGFYVPSDRLQLLDGIDFLRQIDAVPVIAHPLKDTDEATLRDILPHAVEAGLMGMEVFHPSYDSATEKAALQIAEDFKLLKSGGSDFHGKNKPQITLGTGKGELSVPVSFYTELLKAHEKLKK